MRACVWKLQSTIIIAYYSCSLALAYFVNCGAHYKLLLLRVVNCRKFMAMNEEIFESIYHAMKPYFVKHCSPCCGEAFVSCHRCESW